MNKLFHIIGIHDWTKWKKVRETWEVYPRIGFLGPIDTTNKIKEQYFYQVRKCKICGFEEKIRTS